MDLIPTFPFFRFSLRFRMKQGEIHGPRITYIQSLNLIVAGRGTLYTKDAEYVLFPGVQIYMTSGKWHQWVASVDEPFVVAIVFFELCYQARLGVTYPSDFIVEQGNPIKEDYIESLSINSYPEYIVLDDMTEWQEHFSAIFTNYEVCNVEEYPEYLRLQGNFFLFMDYVLNRLVKPKPYLDRRISKFIKESMDLPSGTHIQIDKWTTQNQISRTYFHAIFKQATGYSPSHYISMMRIKRTYQDLIESNKSITQIAMDHHYESVQYYSKVFVKLVGLTPSEYRRRNRIS